MNGVWCGLTGIHVVNLYVSLFSNYKFDHVNIKIEKKMNGVWFGFSRDSINKREQKVNTCKIKYLIGVSVQN